MNTRSLLNLNRRSIYTEKWLPKNFESSELRLNNYSLYRSDSEGITDEKNAHGGVMIAVKTDMDSESVKIEL